MAYLNIIFGGHVHLKFRLRDTSIAKRWAAELLKAQVLGYTIDNPQRFYWFNDVDTETQNALALLNQSIDTINTYRPIIDRKLNSLDDQDTLNYLHHIFEVYHGLLETQTQNAFFITAPKEVQQALAELNIHIHRCEGVSRGMLPRVVVTYYGLPKVHKFDVIDYLHFTNDYQFGTVYINYAEIGKTLEDLAKDNDQYIAEEAFQPCRHYGPDFTIKFFDAGEKAAWERGLAREYFERHRDWFTERGYSHAADGNLVTGRCPVADLETPLSRAQILQQVKDNQTVTRVWIENFGSIDV